MDRMTVESLIPRCVLVNARWQNTADLVFAVRMIPSNRRDRLMPRSHMTYKEAVEPQEARWRGDDASCDVQKETSIKSYCSERKLICNLNRRPESTVGS